MGKIMSYYTAGLNFCIFIII